MKYCTKYIGIVVLRVERRTGQFSWFAVEEETMCSVLQHLETVVDYSIELICCGGSDTLYKQVDMSRGGQNFPKSTEFRNSVAFRPFLAVRFRAFQSVSLNRFPSSFYSSHDVLTYWEPNSG